RDCCIDVSLWSLWSVWSLWFGGSTINGTDTEDQAIRLERPGAAEQAPEKLFCLGRYSVVRTCETPKKCSRRMLKKAVQLGRRRVETGGVVLLTRPPPKLPRQLVLRGVR